MIVRELLTKIGFLFDQGAFNKSQRSFLQLAGIAGAASAAIGGVVYALNRSVHAAVEAGSAAVDGANRLGITAEQYQKLGFVAEQSGASVGSLEGALKFLQRTSFEASKGGKAQLKVFQMLGISAKEAAKQSSPELLGRIADKISALKSPTEQTALATKLLGRSFGTALLPMLKEGSKGINVLMERAEALGFVMSNENAAAAENLGDLFDQLGLAIKGVSIRLGTRLIPIAKRITEAMIDWFVANKQMIDEGLDVLVSVVKTCVDVMFKFGRVINDHKAFFIAFTAVALMPAIKGLGLLTIAMIRNIAVAALAAAPFIILAGLIALIAEDIYVFTQGGQSLLGDFLDAFMGKSDKIDPDDHPIIKVLKTISHWIKAVNKEWNDAGGFFKAWENVKKGVAQDYDRSILGKIDDFVSGRVGSEEREKYRDAPIRMYRRNAEGVGVPSLGSGAFAPAAPKSVIDQGYGPIQIGSVKIETTIAPGTSPEQTIDLVQQGFSRHVDQAARQGGGSRGVR